MAVSVPPTKTPGRLAPGGLGKQAVVCVGGDRLAADTVTGEAAMIIAAAGGHETEILGEGKQAGSFGIWLVGMEDLYPGQAYGGQPGDLLVGHDPRAAGPRVGEDRDTARGADQADAADGR